MRNRLPMAIQITIELGDESLGGLGPYTMTRIVPLSAGRPIDPSGGSF